MSSGKYLQNRLNTQVFFTINFTLKFLMENNLYTQATLLTKKATLKKQIQNLNTSLTYRYLKLTLSSNNVCKTNPALTLFP